MLEESQGGVGRVEWRRTGCQWSPGCRAPDVQAPAVADGAREVQEREGRVMVSIHHLYNPGLSITEARMPPAGN